MQALGEAGAEPGTLLSHLQSKENDWLQLGPLTVIRDIRGLYATDGPRGGSDPQLQHMYNTCRRSSTQSRL